MQQFHSFCHCQGDQIWYERGSLSSSSCSISYAVVSISHPSFCLFLSQGLRIVPLQFHNLLYKIVPQASTEVQLYGSKTFSSYLELITLCLKLRQSNIPYVGFGFFESKRFRAGEVIGHSYGTVVYDKLSVLLK